MTYDEFEKENKRQWQVVVKAQRDIAAKMNALLTERGQEGTYAHTERAMAHYDEKIRVIQLRFSGRG